jgi:hypothetical protein
MTEPRNTLLALRLVYTPTTGSNFLTFDIQLSHVLDNQHATLRFQPLALWYSLPKGLVVWSTIFLATEVFSLVLESLGAPLYITLAVVFGSILVLVCIKLIILAIDMWRRRRRQYGSAV